MFPLSENFVMFMWFAGMVVELYPGIIAESGVTTRYEAKFVSQFLPS